MNKILFSPFMKMKFSTSFFVGGAGDIFSFSLSGAADKAVRTAQAANVVYVHAGTNSFDTITHAVECVLFYFIVSAELTHSVFFSLAFPQITVGVFLMRRGKTRIS
jgi:hypothetical protein